MRAKYAVILGFLLYVLYVTGALVSAQRGGMYQGRADDPAINYLSGPLDNVVDTLNEIGRAHV